MSYSAPSISNYNDNPPSDDGAETASNEITWEKIKEELPDPIKDYADAINTAAANAFAALYEDVGFSVYDTTSAPTVNTWTQIQWTTEDRDPGNNFLSTGYTCPTDGVYQFNASLTYSAMDATSGPAEIAIYLNGAVHKIGTSSAWNNEATPEPVSVNISISDSFSLGDVISVWTRHQGGATEAFQTNDAYNYFNGHRITILG